MGIFDDMQTQGCKRRFLAHLESFGRAEARDALLARDLFGTPLFDDGLRRLARADYWLGLPRRVAVPKGIDGQSSQAKERIVYSFEGNDRIVLRYLAFALHAYDRFFVPNGCFAQLGGGSDLLIAALRDARDPVRDFVFKTDVTSFCTNVEAARVCEALKKVLGDDPALLAFLTWLCLRGKVRTDEGEVAEQTGVLAGCPLSGFFANALFLEFDRAMSAEAKFYIRAIDDIVVLAPDEDEARRLGEACIEGLHRLGLHENERKTCLVAPGQQFAYLEYLFRADGAVDIAPHVLKRYKRAVRLAARAWRRKVSRGQLPADIAVLCFFRQLNVRFFGSGSPGVRAYEKGFMRVITCDDSLAAFDSHVQSYARFIPTGRFGKGNYRLSYRDLKNLGYESLVHARHHGVREAQARLGL